MRYDLWSLCVNIPTKTKIYSYKLCELVPCDVLFSGWREKKLTAPIYIYIENFFGRWMQSDAYQATGCYNLLCAGFVQTNSRIAIGAAISPISSFDANQYDITILIWKVN